MTTLLITIGVLLVCGGGLAWMFLSGAKKLETPAPAPRVETTPVVSAARPQLVAAARLGTPAARLHGLPERVVGLGPDTRKTSAKGFQR